MNCQIPCVKRLSFQMNYHLPTLLCTTEIAYSKLCSGSIVAFCGSEKFNTAHQEIMRMFQEIIISIYKFYICTQLKLDFMSQVESIFIYSDEQPITHSKSQNSFPYTIPWSAKESARKAILILLWMNRNLSVSE